MSDERSRIPPPESLLKPLEMPQKLLLGPGPSNPPPEVYKAMLQPMQGYLHKETLQLMLEIRKALQYVFQTTNSLVFCVSGTGHSGMECALVNLLERNDPVLILENGLWGQRAAEMCRRMGTNVSVLQRPFGECFTMEEIENGLKQFQPVLLFVCHGESSTGVLQPLAGLGTLCHKYNCLLLVDTVISLGATYVPMDELGIDCIYSGSQKVLSCPPGLAPIAFSERAKDRLMNRKSPPASFYFDAKLIGNYFGCFLPEEPQKYHHTGPISMYFALYAALSLIVKEGLRECIERHQANYKLLRNGLQEMGLEFFVTDEHIRLPSLTTVKVPAGVDWKAVIDYLMKHYGIEIAGGLGPTVGKIWRIGFMGNNSREENVQKLLQALKETLAALKAKD